jgi:hypothetical protein
MQGCAEATNRPRTWGPHILVEHEESRHNQEEPVGWSVACVVTFGRIRVAMESQTRIDSQGVEVDSHSRLESRMAAEEVVDTLVNI